MIRHVDEAIKTLQAAIIQAHIETTAVNVANGSFEWTFLRFCLGRDVVACQPLLSFLGREANDGNFLRQTAQCFLVDQCG